MTVARQYPLDLKFRPALGAEDFLLTPGTEAAVAWIDAWPDWPGRVLALIGPGGSGKSHLAAVWCARSGATCIDGGTLTAALADSVLPDGQALVLDHADAVPDPAALFHLINLARERSGYLLLLGEAAPAHWPYRLPDLVSRLASLPVAAIDRPDDATLRLILLKHCADRRLTLTPEAIEYLVKRIERSFAAARAVIARIDAESLSRRRAPTLALLRDILLDLAGDV